jgi:serine protease Do
MLGVALDEVVAEEVESLQLPGVYGAWVKAVGPGSPAETAGLLPNDVVVAYNGQRVESAMALSRMVTETPAGRTVEIRLIRGGKPHLVEAVLGKGKIMTPMAGVAAPRAPRSLGVWIKAIDPAVANYLGLKEGVGMIVQEIQPGSAAEQAGFQKKDILVEIGETPVTSGEQVAAVINATPGSTVPFNVIRGSEIMAITVSF